MGRAGLGAGWAYLRSDAERNCSDQRDAKDQPVGAKLNVVGLGGELPLAALDLQGLL